MKYALFFLQTLAVLAQDGILRFVDVYECKLMYEAGSRNQVGIYVTSFPFTTDLQRI